MIGKSTEVSAKAERRRFSAEDKKRILLEAEACTERGQLGALLRREGIYSSLFQKWRRQFKQAGLDALAPKKRGPIAQPPDERDARIASLEKENAKLAKKLKKAETIIDFQKKVSDLLGIVLPDAEKLEQ
jgi:transposase-like protein